MLILCCLTLISGALADNSGNNESIKNEISELRTIISKLSPEAMLSPENKSEKPEKKINDDNFKIISEMKDKLQEVLDNNRETLSQRPNAEIESLSDIVKIFISGYEKFVSDKTIVESISESIDKLSESYIKFYSDVRDVITLFKIIDILTSRKTGLIDKIKDMDNAKPISQSDVIKILESSFELIKRYSTDSVQKLVNDAIATTSKSSFEDKPNIPSYFIFNILDCFTKMLSMKYESLIMNQKPFAREFESLTYNIEKLIEDLAFIEKSDKTAPNTVGFFINLRNSVSDGLLELKKISKSWNAYFGDVNSLNDQLAKIIKSKLFSEKDLKIFDYLSQN